MFVLGVGKGEPPATQVTLDGQKLIALPLGHSGLFLPSLWGLGEGSARVKAAMRMGMRTRSPHKPHVLEAGRDTNSPLTLF